MEFGIVEIDGDVFEFVDFDEGVEGAIGEGGDEDDFVGILPSGDDEQGIDEDALLPHEVHGGKELFFIDEGADGEQQA